MKFRDQQVDGFFVISIVAESYTAGPCITSAISQQLKALNADMIDVQYSTRADSICDGDVMVCHDVLVMYCKRN